MTPPNKGQALNIHVNIEVGNSNKYQLYNLAASNPEKLAELMAEFKALLRLKQNN